MERKMLMTSAVVVVALATGLVPICWGQSKPAAPSPPAVDVLIVYHSGSTEVSIKEVPSVEAGPLDAVTMPTPKENNVAQLAQGIASKLREAGLTVRCVPVEQAKDPRAVLRAKVLLVGTPSYFGYPSWQVLRFVDEVLFRIYLAGGGRLSGKWVGTFSTADLKGYARSASQHLLRSMGQLRGNKLPGVALGHRSPRTEVDQAITRLVDAVRAGVKK